MRVGRAGCRPPRPLRHALVVVEEDHVQVACVVHLAATKLSHRQHDRCGPLSPRGVFARARLAEPLNEPGLLDRDDLAEEHLGDRCERRRRCLGVLPAQDVADAYPQLLRRFECVEDRAGGDRPVAEFGKI